MTTISPLTRVLLALSSLKGVGPAALKKVAALPKFSEQSFEEYCQSVPQIANSKSISGRSLSIVWQEANDWADEQSLLAEKHGARIISALDEEYPVLLAATKDDPFLLFVKGKFADHPQHSVAIIGTREPTAHGQRIAQSITRFFIEQRWSVVSGLAIGCDAAAHQSAIQEGGHTVAVLAHGLQMIAPSGHKKLAEEILAARGALVSEYPFGTSALGAQFVKRDRVQAGMSRGVVMIQSDLRGGSLHASRAALDYQRWLAVPYPTDRDLEHDEPKIQANRLIADGGDEQRADLLHCSVSSLRLVKVLRGREDYLSLIETDDTGVAPRVTKRDPSAAILREMTLEYAADHPRGSVTQNNTSRNGNSPRPSAYPPLTSELDAAGGAQRVYLQSKSHVAAPVMPPQAARGYHLEVSPEELATLTIVPVSVRPSHSEVHAGEYDLEIASARSRLVHLQMRLDELRKDLQSHVGSERTSLVQFKIEDVVTHMKRTADELVRLDQFWGRQELRFVIVRPSEMSGRSGHSQCAAVEGTSDAPLIEVLGSLVEMLPGSVSVQPDERASDFSENEACTTVHLGDLVFSFNELVRSALVTHKSEVSDKGIGG